VWKCIKNHEKWYVLSWRLKNKVNHTVFSIHFFASDVYFLYIATKYKKVTLSLIKTKSNRGIHCIKIMLQDFHTTSLMKPPFIVVAMYIDKHMEYLLNKLSYLFKMLVKRNGPSF